MRHATAAALALAAVRAGFEAFTPGPPRRAEPFFTIRMRARASRGRGGERADRSALASLAD
jgi:hypothetical protein